MSLKLRTYLEFLERKPGKAELTEYMSGLTDSNQIEFKNLVLFSYYGMEQLAKTEKLHKITDFYITTATIVATIGSLVCTAVLNNLLFKFGSAGFIAIFALLNLVSLMFILHYQKKPIYVAQNTIWQITIKQYLHWLARDSEDFTTILKEFTDQFPEKKSDKFMKLIFKKLVQ
ncbi:hypothetical protein Q0V21_31025 [Paenibacillus sp. 11B]|nr:hypothetical protein [Paenibacillus sp. 11B]MDN8593164.1 hypothetical protein [Paenibacillus sp. 11B]